MNLFDCGRQVGPCDVLPDTLLDGAHCGFSVFLVFPVFFIFLISSSDHLSTYSGDNNLLATCQTLLYTFIKICQTLYRRKIHNRTFETFLHIYFENIFIQFYLKIFF